jgi:ribosomal protein S18 acetylase RimI-like enzyme
VTDLTDPMFLLREGRPTDHPLVLDSWLGGDKYSPAGRDFGPLYMREHKATARAVIARAQLRVAHVPDDEDAIMGWAVVLPEPTDRRVVYYVYTKRDARRLGIAKALLTDFLDGGPVTFTHRPVVHGTLPIPPGWIYDPARNYR